MSDLMMIGGVEHVIAFTDCNTPEYTYLLTVPEYKSIMRNFRKTRPYHNWYAQLLNVETDTPVLLYDADAGYYDADVDTMLQALSGGYTYKDGDPYIAYINELEDGEFDRLFNEDVMGVGYVL